jgi:hypothetical protein
LLCTASFLVLYNLWVSKKITWDINFILLPLWMFLFMCGLLGILSLIAATCSAKPSHKRKYYYGGSFLLLTDVVLFPFLFMIDIKLYAKPTLTWAEVFVPLWVVDGALVITGLILLIFTVGSSSTAVFNLPQVVCFLLALAGAISFKVLLVIDLDGNNPLGLSYSIVMIPLWCLLFFTGTCGVSIAVRKPPPEVLDSSTFDSGPDPISSLSAQSSHVSSTTTQQN